VAAMVTKIATAMCGEGSVCESSGGVVHLDIVCGLILLLDLLEKVGVEQLA